MSTASQVLLSSAPATNTGPLASKSPIEASEVVQSAESRGGVESKAFAKVLADQKQSSQQSQSSAASTVDSSEQTESDDQAAPLSTLADGNHLPIGGEALPLPTIGAASTVELPGAAENSVVEIGGDSASTLLTAADASLSATLSLAGQQAQPEARPDLGGKQLIASLLEVGDALKSSHTQPAATATMVMPTDAISMVPMARTTMGLNLELKLQGVQNFSDSNLDSGLDAVNLSADDLASLPKKTLAELVINTKLDKAPTVTMESLTTLNQAIQASSQSNTQPQYQQVANTAAQVALASPVMMVRPGWGEAVVDKVMWMSAQNLKTAEIALDPPELGALQIRVSTQNDQTSVSFSSPHANVREALDQNINRLREMIQSEGLQLVDADVNEQRSNREQLPSDPDTRLSEDEILEEQGIDPHLAAAEKIRIASPVGLVDQYA